MTNRPHAILPEFNEKKFILIYLLSSRSKALPQSAANSSAAAAFP
jgi:hypothetical protein